MVCSNIHYIYIYMTHHNMVNIRLHIPSKTPYPRHRKAFISTCIISLSVCRLHQIAFLNFEHLQKKIFEEIEGLSGVKDGN